MSQDRPQTLGEEIADSISHGVALRAALVGAPLLMYTASELRAARIAGAVFLVLDARLRYVHAVWHGFVAAGTGFPFFAVMDYAA
jgi:hemolysin III